MSGGSPRGRASQHRRRATSAFLKERVLSRLCRPPGRLDSGCSSSRQQVSLAGETRRSRDSGLPWSGEGGQGRAEPARRGGLDGPVIVVDRLVAGRPSGLPVRGLSLGVVAAGSVFSGGLAELGGRAFLRRARGWGDMLRSGHNRLGSSTNRPAWGAMPKFELATGCAEPLSPSARTPLLGTQLERAALMYDVNPQLRLRLYIVDRPHNPGACTAR